VRTLEFDQSQLFRKVYSDEFGMPGGEPYSVLLGDYEIRHSRARITRTTTLDTPDGHLRSRPRPRSRRSWPRSSPALLELTNFADLAKPMDLSRTFDHLDYLKWKSFRKTEDARYVA